MSLFDIGRLCVKLAGRDAGKVCVVVETINSVYVLVDGKTRRRKVNVHHLEPLAQVLPLKKGASHEDVVNLLGKEGLVIVERKSRTHPPRPRRQKVKHEHTEKVTGDVQSAQPQKEEASPKSTKKEKKQKD